MGLSWFSVIIIEKKNMFHKRLLVIQSVLRNIVMVPKDLVLTKMLFILAPICTVIYRSWMWCLRSCKSFCIFKCLKQKWFARIALTNYECLIRGWVTGRGTWGEICTKGISQLIKLKLPAFDHIFSFSKPYINALITYMRSRTCVW